jgi:succinate dehydrogenase/fumarate reductase flavoprotein subunit
MWADVGLVRDAAGLARAASELQRLDDEVAELLAAAETIPGAAAAGGPLRELLETRNLVTAGALVTAAAALRRESRGAHHRLDHPSEDADWRRRILVTARPGAEPLLTLSVPIVEPPTAVTPEVAERAAQVAELAVAGRVHGVIARGGDPGGLVAPAGEGWQ